MEMHQYPICSDWAGLMVACGPFKAEAVSMLVSTLQCIPHENHLPKTGKELSK
ncbi:hypothetical protein H6786_01135 [Candidatus Nomurabacteria bacterium]|nr:hypothetical protein [Candidatus Nomurabacteria bacterium]